MLTDHEPSDAPNGGAVPFLPVEWDAHVGGSRAGAFS
jgi:hypothetical protein